MTILKIDKTSRKNQYIFSVLAIVIVSSICYAFSSLIGYRVVAYILLISVSLLAMLFDILPVLVAAILSALIWDFFFIVPYFTFQVSSAEDTILLLMYFVVALVNAALTYKLRKMEKATILKEEKENTLKLYNTLLNSLSHELRTPIAAIIAATDNLQNDSSRLSALNRNELVAEIEKASFRLNQQVENLLNMSRLESGAIQPKNDWCDVNELIYDTVKRIEENNISQRISININPAIPLFKLDKGLLEQVLYNILVNASQYTPPDSLIEIISTHHANILEIIIQDNGNGFPKDEIEAVFDKFYRLKNNRSGGTGLGLSIVRGFTEAMGGAVSLENISTGGAKFFIEIPAKTSYLQNMKNE
ncbi:MAG: sensor histidine kinase [Bacteroidetes bacterium 46-16]|nr:MAG: sensor histidine kinase [Bacteroidetes bacterium 46-16]